MEWVESTGRSIEAAKEAALDRLGVHEDDAEFDVLTEPRVGLFGRIKEDARVRARVRPTAPRAKEDRRRGRGRERKAGSGGSGGRGSGRKRRSEGRPAEADESRPEDSPLPPASSGDRPRRGKQDGKEARRARDRSRKGSDEEVGARRDGGRDNGGGRRSRRDRSNDRDRDGRAGDRGTKPGSEGSRQVGKQEERSVSDHDQGEGGPSLEEQAALAEEFVAGLAERFGTSVTFHRDELKDDILRIEASGDDIGILVGRKGSTAQAIDDLVRTVLQRAGGTTREGKIRVDIGGVRARRVAALAEFSRKVAADVIASGDEIVLEPMGGADRKLVHDVVNEIEGVETRSEGEDPYRRVVISPASGET